MTSRTHQIHDAREQLRDLLKNGIALILALLAVIILLEIWIGFDTPLFFLGCLVGAGYAVLNLWILFKMLAPFFFYGEKPLHILYGVLLSLTVGGTLLYVSVSVGLRFSLGLAFGIATPAVFGTVYALQSLSTSPNRRYPA